MVTPLNYLVNYSRLFPGSVGTLFLAALTCAVPAITARATISISNSAPFTAPATGPSVIYTVTGGTANGAFTAYVSTVAGTPPTSKPLNPPNWAVVAGAAPSGTLTSNFNASGTASITVNVTANPGSSHRGASNDTNIAILSVVVGTAFQKPVLQAGATPTLNFVTAGNVSSSNLTFSNVTANGAGLQYNITTNTFWNSTVDANSTAWLHASTLTGGGNTTLNNTVVTLTADANGGLSRTGTVTYHSTDFSTTQTVTVNQLGSPPFLTLTPSSFAPVYSGTTGSTITVQSNKDWTPATTNATWITITNTGNSSGSGNVTGNGTIVFNVAANTIAQSRNDTISVTGNNGIGQKLVTVTQDAAPPVTNITPTSGNYDYQGGNSSISVTTNVIQWSASSNVSWILPDTSNHTTGTSNISYVVQANNNFTNRTGVIFINDQLFTVNQLTAQTALVPSSANVSYNGTANGSFIVDSGHASWTAVSSDSWVVVTSGSPGSNTGNVTYAVASNPTNQPRSATITADGQAFVVYQDAGPSFTSINPTGANFGFNGTSSNQTITVTSNEFWSASSSANWTVIQGAFNGTGNGTVKYTVLPNGNTSTRSASITINNNIYTVNQTGPAANTTISPTSKNFPQGGASGTVITVLSNTNWTATPSDTWISIIGSGNGTSPGGNVTFDVAANPLLGSRSGNITIADKVYSITQNGLNNVTNLTPTSFSAIPAGGSRQTIAVNSTTAWTAVSNVTWVTINSGSSGSGNGTIIFTVGVQPLPASRDANITVNESVCTIHQFGASTFIKVSPANVTLTNNGTSSANITVTSNDNWSAAPTYNSNDPAFQDPAYAWVFVNGGSNITSSGNGTFNYSVSPNFLRTSRTANISVFNDVITTRFRITQAGSPATVSLSPTSFPTFLASASGNTAIVTTANVNWTATPSVGWIIITDNVTSPGNDTIGFNGTVQFQVLANGNVGTRTGFINIGGQTVNVSQLGVNATTSLNPTSFGNLDSGAHQDLPITVTSNVPWTAASKASWILINSGSSGTGNGIIKLLVQANPTVSNRTSNITVSAPPNTVVCNITQLAGPAVITLTPSSANFTTAGASNQKFALVSNAPWTATVDPSATSWLSLVGNTSGPIGNGTVTYTVQPSAVGFTRVANISLAYANSTVSNFTVTQAGVTPTISVNPTSQNVTANATANLSINVTSNTQWPVSTDSDWITITSNATGVGNDTLTYDVAENDFAFVRTGTINIGGLGFIVTQEAAVNNTTLNPNNNSNVASGGATDLTFDVTSNADWTAVPSDTWISITDGGSAIGNGTVTYSVASNGFAANRTGNITVAGAVFTITQLSASEVTSLSPSSNSYTSNGATGQVVDVTSNANWTAAPSNGWIVIAGGNTGSGNGNFTYAVLPNAGNTTRGGSIAVNSQIFLITQTGSNSTTSPSSFNLPYTQSLAQNISVTTTGSWVGITDADWLTFNGTSSGSTNATVLFDVAFNPTHVIRTGNIIIDGQTSTVTQDPAPNTNITPTSFSFGAGAALGQNITVTASVDWTAASDSVWITFNGSPSGSGNGTVVFNVAANGGTSPRSGNITIDGQVCAISQDGAAAFVNISPLAQNVTAAGSANLSINVTANTVWTAVASDTWITITGGNAGSGNGVVSYSVAANSAGTPRSGNITVSGQVCTITQDAAVAPFTNISPTTKSLPAAQSTGVKITVTSNTNWTATKNAAWLFITAGASGSGNGTVTYRTSTNTTTSKRVGKITINGKVCTITQAAKTAASRSLTVQISNAKPHIVTQPKSAAFQPGETVRFNVLATGGAPLAYAWSRNSVELKNGPHITGATTRNLTLTRTTASTAGYYTVRVSNSKGHVVSNQARLTLKP